MRLNTRIFLLIQKIGHGRARSQKGGAKEGPDSFSALGGGRISGDLARGMGGGDEISGTPEK